MDNNINKYEPFFGEWKIRRELGEGTYGKAYELYRVSNPEESSFLKYVHLPKATELQKKVKEYGDDYDEIRRKLRREIEQKIDKETRLLKDLKGHNNIVRYEEHILIDNVGNRGIGWDLLLRAELLSPIDPIFANKKATQYDVMVLWLHLLKALRICERKGILHRDIKPSNIMISRDGQFKFTDFGEGCYMKGSGVKGIAGNLAYMAPEVYKNAYYDQRADMYSAGLVIYYFMNGQKRWFCDKTITLTKNDQLELSTKRRMSGEQIPPVEGLSEELNRILMKMIAFKPEDRYMHAQQAYDELIQVALSQESDLKKKLINEKRSFLGGLFGGR